MTRVESLTISLFPLVDRGDDIQVRVTDVVGEEVGADLERAGLQPSRVLEFSALADTAVWVVSASAGISLTLKQLAPILETFFRRHQDKRIVFKCGEEEYTVEGGSFERMNEAIKRFQQTHDDQKARWDEVMRQWRIEHPERTPDDE